MIHIISNPHGEYENIVKILEDNMDYDVNKLIIYHFRETLIRKKNHLRVKLTDDAVKERALFMYKVQWYVW